MFNLFLVDFYITHHCNMNCDSCNRFNNYNFKGHKDWRPYAQQYEKWAQNTKIQWINILGGEPLLHPDITGWIKQVRQWWPTSTLTVFTNGTMLNKVPNLYDTVKENNCILYICTHNKHIQDNIFKELDKFFPVEYSVHEPDPDVVNSVVFTRKIITDKNGVCVHVKPSTTMHPSTLLLKNDVFKLHNSDPVRAHSVCWNAQCHHFIDGKIYKCGMVPLLAEFNTQYLIDVNEVDLALIQNPGGYTFEEASSNQDEFLHYLKNHIEHCKFCPEELTFRDVQASIGKTFVPINLKKM
jgi:organic radical activating enzyme